MKKILLKRGRKGIPLSNVQRKILLNILSYNKLTVPELASHIGISPEQLAKPLRGDRNCSRESFKKISKFLERK